MTRNEGEAGAYTSDIFTYRLPCGIRILVAGETWVCSRYKPSSNKAQSPPFF